MLDRSDFTILYGSQTGQAKAIAEEIYDNCSTHGLNASIFCLSLIEKKFCINEEKCVVFVVSTTGDGEPPDTVRKFFRRINKKTLADSYLCNLRFGFLALGDSNYTNFCNCGKSIEKRILELGAKPFYPTGYADDAVGLELVVDPWIEGLWPSLLKHLGKSTQAVEIHSVFVRSQEKGEDRAVEDNNKPKSLVDLNSKSGKAREIDSISNNLEMESDNIKESGTPMSAKRIWSQPSQDLIGKGLKVPLSPHPFLELDFQPEASVDIQNLPLHNNATFQAAVSDVKMVNIVRAEQLTTDDAVKTALELEIDVQELNITYEPGDTFGIVCPNEDKSVEDLISRIGIKAEADIPISLKILANTNKRNAAVPEYMPNPSTLRHLLQTCIDIKAVPKRALIRMLVDYTDDVDEKRRLQELCSTQGANDYMTYIREPYTGLMDVLNAFPSCNPPIQRLLELLPRLQPRAYSITSSPLQNKRTVKFVFNVTIINGLDGVTVDRTGLCTGWLEKLTSKIMCTNCKKCDGCGTVEFEDLGKQVQKLSIRNDLKIPVYWRRGTNFKMLEDETVPIIMIGPGTGVAPFISFLCHREMQKKLESSKEFGPMVLFYGCRHKERDFLYRKKIESLLEQKILTKLFTSFSRDDPCDADAPRYVQDNLKLQKDFILPLISEQKAIVYICGDAKNMARNVHETFTDLFKEHLNITSAEAISYIKRLREEQRYLEDIWT